jgi:disulfide oxidoreductase YuzD
MSEDYINEKKETDLSQNIKDLLILYSVLSLEDKLVAKREIRNAEIF